MPNRQIRKNYRMDEDVVKALDKRARESKTTANSLLNKYVKSGMIHEALQQCVHAQTMGRDIIQGFIELVDEEDVKKIAAKMGTENPKKLFTANNVEPTLETVIEALEDTYSKECSWYQFSHHMDKDTHHLVFIHESSAKWTGFVKIYTINMFKSLLNTEPKVINIDDKMLELAIKEEADKTFGKI